MVDLNKALSNLSLGDSNDDEITQKKETETNSFSPVFLSESEQEDYSELLERTSEKDFFSLDTLKFWEDDYEMTEADKALKKKAKEYDKTVLYQYDNDDKFKTSFNIELFESLYKDRKDKAPDYAVSNIFNIFDGETNSDYWNKSLEDTMKVSPERFDILLKDAKSGNEKAINHINSVINLHRSEFIKWKKENGATDDEIKNLGFEDIKNGIIGNINNKNASLYEDYADIDTVDEIADSLGNFATGAISTATWFGNELTTAPIKNISDTLDLFGYTDKSNAINDFINPYEELINNTISKISSTGKNMNESTDSIAGDVTSVVAELASLAYGGILKAGAKAGQKTAMLLGEKGVQSFAKKETNQFVNRFLIESADFATDTILTAGVLGLRDSVVNDTKFIDEFKEEVLFSAGVYGVLKGAKYIAKSTPISSTASFVADNTYKGFKFGKKASTPILKTLSNSKTRMTDFLVNKGVPLDKAKSVVSSIQDNIKNTYEKLSVKSGQLFDDINTHFDEKQLNKYSSGEREEIRNVLKEGITLNDLKSERYGNGDILKGVREYNNASKGLDKYNDLNINIQEHRVLDRIENKMNAFKKTLSKLDISDDIFKNLNYKGLKEIIDNSNSPYSRIALKQLDEIDSSINNVNSLSFENGRKVLKKGDKKVPVDKDRLFSILFANADDVSQMSMSRKISSKLSNILTGNKKLNTVDKALSQKVKYRERMEYLTSEHFDKFDKISKDTYKVLSDTLKNKTPAQIINLSSSFERARSRFLKNGETTSKDVKRFVRDFSEIASKYTYERDITTALRSANLANEVLLINPEFHQLSSVVAQDSLSLKNVSHRTALKHSIENNVKISDSKGVYYMDGDDIIIIDKSRSGDSNIVTAWNGNSISEYDITKLKEVPIELASKLDIYSRNISELTKSIDDVLRVSGVMDEDLMMSDTYFKTILLNKSTKKPLTTEEVAEVRNALSKDDSLSSFLQSSKPTFLNTVNKTSKKRKFKTDNERDLFLEEKGLNVITNRDPFKSVLSVTHELPNKIKQIEISNNLRTISKFSRNTRSVFSLENVENELSKTRQIVSDLKKTNKDLKILESLEDIDRVLDKYDVMFKSTNNIDSVLRSMDEAGESVDLMLGRLSDVFEQYQLKTVKSAVSKDVKNTIKHRISTYRQLKKDILESESELSANGFTRASDVNGIKEFSDIWLSPEEVRGLKNLEEPYGKGTLATITKAVMFQRSLIATGDLFMSYKTVMSSFTTDGLNGVKNQLKINTKALKAVAKDVKTTITTKGELNKDGSVIESIINESEMVKDLKDAQEYISVSHLDFNQMYQNTDDISRALNGNKDMIDRFKEIYGVQKTVDVLKVLEDAQFNIMLPHGKAKAFKSLADKMVADARKSGGRVDIHSIKIEAGKVIDDMFSGQNWDIKLAQSNWLNKKLIKRAGPLMLFATDFFATKINQIARVVKTPFEVFSNSPKGYIARNVMVKKSIEYFTMLNALSYGLNGHSTLENGDDSWWMLKAGDTRDAQGNPVYINLFGIQGQSMSLLNSGPSNIQYQLSIPVQLGHDTIWGNKYESKDSFMQAMLKQTTPMGIHGIIDTASMNYFDNFSGYGTLDWSDRLTMTFLELFGAEGKPIKEEETKVKLFDMVGIGDNTNLSKKMSLIEKGISYVSGNNIKDSEYKISGIDGDTNFSKVQDILNNKKYDEFISAVSLKEEIADNKSKKFGIEVKPPKFDKMFSLFIGGMTADYIANGMNQEDALRTSMERFIKMFPNKVPPKITSIQNDVIKYSFGASLKGEPFKIVKEMVNEVGIDGLMSMGTKDIKNVLAPYRDSGQITATQFKSIIKNFTEFKNK